MAIILFSYIFKEVFKLLSFLLVILTLFTLVASISFVSSSILFAVLSLFSIGYLFYLFRILKIKKILKKFESDFGLEYGSVTGYLDYRKNRFYGNEKLADDYMEKISDVINQYKKKAVKKNIKSLYGYFLLLTSSLIVFSKMYEKSFIFKSISFYDIFEVLPAEKLHYLERFSKFEFILKPKMNRSVYAIINGKRNPLEFDGENFILALNAGSDMDIKFYSQVYSDLYRIRVLKELEFDAICIVTPPAYTGIKPYEIKNAFSLTVPQGSHIKYIFNFFETPESIKSRAGSVYLTRKTGVYEKMVSGDFSDEVVIKAHGYSDRLITIKVNAIPDNPPYARIISPQNGVTLPLTARVPVVYEYEDDYGIVSAELCIKTIYSLSKRKLAREKKNFGEEIIDLAAFSGDYLDLYIEAGDGINPLTLSNTVRIYILNREAVYKKEIEGLNDIYERVMKILKDEIEVEKNINEKNFENAITTQKNLDGDYRDLISALEKLNAPIYRDMLEALENIHKKDVVDVIQAINNKEYMKALETLKDVISQLEKMTHNLSSYKRELNLSNMLEDVSEARKMLESAYTSESLNEISSMLKKVEESFKKIMEKIKNMPQLLPEDFVNKFASKNIDFNSMMNKLMDAMNAAGARDISTARKILEELLNDLKNMEKMLDEMSTPSMDSSDLAGRIRGIAQKEKELADDTYNYMKSFERAFKERVLKMQREVYNDYRKISKNPEEKKVEEMMWQVADFIEKENYENAKNLLSETTNYLKALNQRSFLNREKKVYEMLTSRTKFMDRSRLDGLYKKQEDIRNQTLGIKADVEKMFAKRILPSDIHTRLKKAGIHMENASKMLLEGSIVKAYNSQMDALKELLDAGRRNFSMDGKGGMEMGGGGFYGVRIEDVKLPTKESYKKPYELRDEIMKSLNERKPFEAKEIIDRYLQELIR